MRQERKRGAGPDLGSSGHNMTQWYTVSHKNNLLWLTRNTLIEGSVPLLSYYIKKIKVQVTYLIDLVDPLTLNLGDIHH